MPVRRDKRTGAWIFQVTVKRPDGTKARLFGTPGIPGPYHDLARTQAGAKEAERKAIAEAMLGKPLVAVAKATEEAPKTKENTIREHSVTFLEKYKPESKPAAKRDRQASVSSLLPHFGDMTIEQLKQTDVDTFVASELKRKAARKSINNRLACLSSLIKYATGERCTLRLHIGGADAEIHAVDPADVERLLDACNDDRERAIILLAYESGLRAGEIRGLMYSDQRNGQLTIRRALDKETNEAITPKHDKVRTVPLSPRVTEVLAKLPRRGLWVVSRDDGGALGYWPMLEIVRAIYTRAEVTVPESETGRAMPMHALRHSHGTVMAKRVPLPVLQKLLGHSEIETTMRYVDVSEADKREAIAAVFGDGRASHAQAETDSVLTK
jgi:integrase